MPRRHVETIVDDTGVEYDVKLGVWLTNTWVRRSPLTEERAAALNHLGLRWA